MSDYGEQLDASTVRFVRLLPGPIDRVWEYLVDPDKRARWLCGGKTDESVGGNIDLLFHNATLPDVPDDPPPAEHESADQQFLFHGSITRYEPPHAFAHTWDYEDVPSEVCYELEEVGDRVRLTLTHSRLASQKEVLDVCGGWHTHLDILLDELSGEPRRAFWRTMEAVLKNYHEQIGA